MVIFGTILASGLLGLMPIAALSAPTPAMPTNQPTDQLMLKVGERRKVFIGIHAIQVEILKIGSDGWVLVEIVEDFLSVAIRDGEKYWLNTSQIWMISAEQP
jgi:hypothetical protein